MTQPKPENPPAFPSKVMYDHGSFESNKIIHEGMTLRDYFAGQAMMGMCANPDVTAPTYNGSRHDVIAQTAYGLADAMLAERLKE